MLRRIDRAGIENVALLNVENGLVEGRSGRFLIDEKLIPKLQFISKGHFSEEEGAPALRLLGDVEAIQGANVDVAAEVVDHVHVSDDVLIEAFVSRTPVSRPQLFIEQLAHTTKLWLPVFAFVRMAGLTDEQAAALVRDQKGAKARMAEQQGARILDHRVPAGAAKPGSAEPERSAIIAQTLSRPATEKQCKAFLKAVRTLTDGMIDPDYLLPLLDHCWQAFDAPAVRSLTQYAIAHADVILHKQERTSKGIEGTSTA